MDGINFEVPNKDYLDDLLIISSIDGKLHADIFKTYKSTSDLYGIIIFLNESAKGDDNKYSFTLKNGRIYDGYTHNAVTMRFGDKELMMDCISNLDFDKVSMLKILPRDTENEYEHIYR